MNRKRRRENRLAYAARYNHDHDNHEEKARGRTLSSHNKGKCNKISRGSVSAAMTIKSVIPRFNVFVASLAPFFNCL